MEGKQYTKSWEIYRSRSE